MVSGRHLSKLAMFNQQDCVAAARAAATAAVKSVIPQLRSDEGFKDNVNNGYCFLWVWVFYSLLRWAGVASKLCNNPENTHCYCVVGDVKHDALVELKISPSCGLIPQNPEHFKSFWNNNGKYLYLFKYEEDLMRTPAVVDFLNKYKAVKEISCKKPQEKYPNIAKAQKTFLPRAFVRQQVRQRGASGKC
jgi:hypothetical protein